MTDPTTAGRQSAGPDGWDEWISPSPAAAPGVVGTVAAAVADVVDGGDDADAGAEASDGRQYTDEELDVDHDGDVDMDDVNKQNLDNLCTGMQTTNLIMASEGAEQAQLAAIDAIYGND